MLVRHGQGSDWEGIEDMDLLVGHIVDSAKAVELH